MKTTTTAFLRFGARRGALLAVLLALGVATSLVSLGAQAGAQTVSAPTNYTVEDLGTLGGNASYASAINDSGEVAGSSYLTNYYEDPHAFLYSGGQMKDLGTLGGSRSEASALNESGQMVGYAYLANDYDRRAFLYSEGQMKDLNDLIPTGSGIVLESAEKINDNGQILARGIVEGQDRAFLLTPATDDTAPTVTSTTPTKKTGVSRTKPGITATFSEPVDKATVEALDPTTQKSVNVKLINTATGKQVAATVRCDADPCNKATITPKKELAASTKYKATVTTGVKDLAGNALDQNPTKTGTQPKNWTFTTGS